MVSDENSGPGIAHPPLSLSLTGEQIAAVFPFHIVFDKDLRICQLGKSISKLLPDLKPGDNLRDHCEIERPSIGFFFEQILAQRSSLFILLVHRGTLRLRGQMLPQSAESSVAFLCSPWLPEPGEFRASGLTFEDFPLHDSMPEFMNVVQAQRLGMEDLRKLSNKLRLQREMLKDVNEKLLAQSAESRKLAMIAARTNNWVLVTDARGRIEWVNEAFERATGYTLDEVRGVSPGQLLQRTEADGAIAAYMNHDLSSDNTFRCEVLNYSKEGRRFWVAIEVQPMCDEAGNILNFMYIKSDITAQKEDAFRKELAHAVTTILAEATDTESALHNILQIIVVKLEFQFGAVWRLDAQKRCLRAARFWSVPALTNSSFAVATMNEVFERGAGLPGLVLEGNSLLLIPNIERASNFPRQQAALADGLRSGFAFPIRVGAEPRGVMEFFSSGISQPDQELLSTLNALGNQIGQFMERNDAEAERTRLLSLLHSTLESTADGILVADLEQRFVTWNQRFLDVWRIPEAMMENNRTAIVEFAAAKVNDPAEFKSRIAHWYNNPLKSGEDAVHFSDGRVFLRSTQPQIANSIVIGRVWSYRDITATWRAEENLRDSEERYRLISSTASDGIVTVNRRSKILFANEAAGKIFGCPVADLVGRRAFDLLAEDPHELTHRRLLRKMIHPPDPDRPGLNELMGRRSNGDRIPLEVSLSKSRIRGELVFTGVIRDITIRRQAEERLLEAMRQTEAANRAKSDFLASVSHEIRTPLNSIAGLTELLRGTHLDEDQRDMVNTVWVGSESLLNLINDLLDFSKIEAGQMEIATEVFDPLAVCERAVEIVGGRAAKKGLALVCISTPLSPPQMVGDANRILQILLNLVVNGVKFTEAGFVSLCLDWKYVDQNRASAVFSVRDTGIGIAAEDRHRIFEKFYRVDTMLGRSAGGTGLGLSIARLLAEKMGGSIDYEDMQGRGSRFRLQLEMPVSQEGKIASTLDSHRPSALLLTDTNSQDLLCNAWRSMGLQIHSFAEAAQACSYLKTGCRCDLVLLGGSFEQKGEDFENLVKLLCSQGEPHWIRLRMPHEPVSAMPDLPGNVVALEFPLTPNRMTAALRRLYTRTSGTQRSVSRAEEEPLLRTECPSQILLVEDNADSQNYARRVFAKSGHRITVAGSVAETLHAVASQRFDVIFMDVMLPDGSGFDAAHKVRTYERSTKQARSPIVALTASAMQEYRNRAFEADMDDYLTKPVRAELLLAAVRKWSSAANSAVSASCQREVVQVDPDMADLIPEYLVAVRSSLDRVRAVDIDADSAEVVCIGHDLKGSGGAYGFPEITKLGDLLERAARNRDAVAVKSTTKALLFYLDRVQWKVESV